MAFTSFDLLGAVVTALFSAYPGSLHRLAVDDSALGWGPSSGAPALACAELSASSPTSHPNARSESSDRRSSCCREVVGQQSPGAAAAHDVEEDGVYDLAGAMQLGASGSLGAGQVRFEAAPFGV